MVDYKIIDNALNDSLLTSIQEHVESNRMPWHFLKNSAYPDSIEKEITKFPLTYSFGHMALDKGDNYISPFGLADITIPIGLILKDLFELEKSYSVHRLRWGMTTSINKSYKNTPHIDFLNPHKVILFYLNESDGDTYFYDKEHKILDSVSPRENRAVLFDGSILHSSSKPIKFTRRIVLNINLIKES